MINPSVNTLVECSSMLESASGTRVRGAIVKVCRRLLKEVSVENIYHSCASQYRHW